MPAALIRQSRQHPVGVAAFLARIDQQVVPQRAFRDHEVVTEIEVEEQSLAVTLFRHEHDAGASRIAR